MLAFESFIMQQIFHSLLQKLTWLAPVSGAIVYRVHSKDFPYAIPIAPMGTASPGGGGGGGGGSQYASALTHATQHGIPLVLYSRDVCHVQTTTCMECLLHTLSFSLGSGSMSNEWLPYHHDCVIRPTTCKDCASMALMQHCPGPQSSDLNRCFPCFAVSPSDIICHKPYTTAPDQCRHLQQKSDHCQRSISDTCGNVLYAIAVIGLARSNCNVGHIKQCQCSCLSWPGCSISDICTLPA